MNPRLLLYFAEGCQLSPDSMEKLFPPTGRKIRLKDPTIVLSRTTDYIFEPIESYEKMGQVGCVVFPCGAVVRGDTIFMYYGGGDSVLDVASISMKKLLDVLSN